ncbi:acyltransferase [Arsenicicoccus dermatophilus]|uniref:acyltransferase n=1 Tax=Arsenicicoccus dermatophilus TaxID=1076331 RepID=UPI0039171EBA
MGLKDLYRHVRTDVLPKEQLRRRNPRAYVTHRAVFRGDPSRVDLAPEVYVAGPSILVCEDGGGLTGSRIVVGERTYIGEFNNIRTAGAPIVIGARCLISQHITIVGSNHGTAPGRLIVDQPWSGDGVTIGDGVWVGAGSVILPGTRIGDGVVVAANSVVRGEIPADSIVAGAPARVIRGR